jgi:hypothetical protein
MAPYGDTSDVRALARSVLVADFSDAEILEEQIMAQSKIWTVTKKADWDTLDVQYPFIKKKEIQQAAIYVLQHYNVIEIQPILELWQKEIDSDLLTIIDSVEDPSVEDADLEISSKPYQTYPLNPTARISRGRLTQVGFNPALDMDTTVYSSKYDL